MEKLRNIKSKRTKLTARLNLTWQIPFQQYHHVFMSHMPPLNKSDMRCWKMRR